MHSFAKLHNVQLSVHNPPPEIYDNASVLEMVDRQRNLFVGTWLVEHAWINPSLVIDPEDSSKLVMVWRMWGKSNKMGYFWLDANSFKSIKTKDMIGTLLLVIRYCCLLLLVVYLIFTHHTGMRRPFPLTVEISFEVFITPDFHIFPSKL